MSGAMRSKGWKTAAIAAALMGLTAAGARAGDWAGYVKITVPAGLSIVSVPFVQMDGSAHTLGTALKGLPADTEALVYSAVDGYTTYTYIDGTWQDSEGGDAGAVELARGTAVWIKNVSGSAATIVIRGKVPVSNIAQSVGTGLQLVGYAFPSGADLDTYGPAGAQDGDTFYIYDNGYTILTFVDGQGWSDSEGGAVDYTLQPGVGYWYSAQGSGTWNQARNFSL